MTTRRVALGGLRLDPELFHLVEDWPRRGSCLPREALLDGREAPLELGVGAPQGAFGIDLEMAGKIGDREQKIADLVLDPVGARPGGFLNLLQFLVDLVDDLSGLGPVEPDLRGLGGQLLGAGQGGQGRGTPARKPASSPRARPALAGGTPLGLLLGLDLVPERLDLFRRQVAASPKTCGWRRMSLA